MGHWLRLRRLVPRLLSSEQLRIRNLESTTQRSWADHLSPQLYPSPPSTSPSSHYLTLIVDLKWAFPLLSTLILLLSIHFSSTLRRVLSHRWFVFLGSISFPMYLIHSFMMRSVLVWVIYGLIPESGGIVRRMNDHGPNEKSIFWSVVTVVAMGLWF